MIRKCANLVTRMPYSLLKSHQLYAPSVCFRFSKNAKNQLNQISAQKVMIDNEALRRKDQFSRQFSVKTESGQQGKESLNEEMILELSLQQKMYFAQIAGVVLLLNMLVRMFIKTDRHQNIYEKKQ